MGKTQDAEQDERAMFIAAAQLRVVTDRRQGKVTPEWVKHLADEKLTPVWLDELSQLAARETSPETKAVPTMSPSQRRVQVAAAKLRVTLDARLGRVTPQSVKKLAAGDI